MFAKMRRTFPPLLGERAGVREDDSVTNFFAPHSWQIYTVAFAAGRFNRTTQEPQSSSRRPFRATRNCGTMR
jgi:hypothetical protein